MASSHSTPRRRRMRRWVRRYLRWWRRRKVLGSLVTAFALAVVAVFGTVVGTKIVDELTDDYTLTVEDNPDLLSTATGPLGNAYIVPTPIEDVGDPPNGNDSCVGRYEWARKMDAIDADSTFVRLTVKAATDHNVRITDFAPRVLARRSPAIGTHLTCPGRGEQPEERSIGIDLDGRPPNVSVTDESGVALSTVFDVSGDESETFAVTANTFTCDCTWVLDVHLLVDGQEETATVEASDGQPFETSSSVNARSYRFESGEWQSQAESGQGGQQGTETAPPPPIDACQLLDTATIAALLQQGVTPQPLGPVTSPGVSENLLTETRCTWEGSASPPHNTRGTGALDSVDLSLDQFNDTARASAELQARLPMYSGLTERSLANADDVYAGDDGTVLARQGPILVTVQVLADPNAAQQLAERFINEVLAKL